MQWTDEGIVLGAKRHGEANAILELMTCEHGRHLGLVRGGFGSRLKPVLQTGNTVSASWRARLDEHLGNYTVEGLSLRAASFFSASHAIYGVTHLAGLMRLLPERDPHAGLYHALDEILGHLDDAVLAAPMVVRFELQLLSELGFGLDLEKCVVTGASGDLVYVSP
ncbi:MAG: DNA repair protein RecO, partial [Pseudolabrys sp.]